MHDTQHAIVSLGQIAAIVSQIDAKLQGSSLTPQDQSKLNALVTSFLTEAQSFQSKIDSLMTTDIATQGSATDSLMTTDGQHH